MALKVIILSDLHIKDKKSIIFTHLDKLINCIKYDTNDSEEVLLVFDGDISFSGKEEEYEIALEIFSRIKGEIGNIKFLIIPGNHDCDFSGDVSIRNTILESSDPLTAEKLNFLATVQKNFLDFKEALEGNEINNNTPFLWKTDITDNNLTISFYGYNTALFSKKYEEYGRVRFPDEYLIRPEKDDKNINIAIFHHPIEWGSIQERSQARSFFGRNFDLIITGHEHQVVGETVKNQLENSNIIKISAGALLDENNGSTFAILEIDNKKHVTVNYFQLENNLYKRISSFEEDIASRKFVELNEDFEDFLDKRTFLQCSTENALSIKSLFISPTLYLTTGKGKNVYPDKINFDNILFEKLENKCLFIKGGSYFGKTTLLKRLFLERLKQKKLPIYLKGKDFNSQNIKDEKMLLKKAFSKCYNIEYSLFENENENNRCILIDDIDYNIKRSEILSLIKRISRISSEIILTVSDSFKEVSITSSQEDSFLFTNFSFFEIVEWNNEQKLDLYEKWIISRGISVSPVKIERFKKETALVFKKGFMPAVPFFLISYFYLIEDRSEITGISTPTTCSKFYDAVISVSLLNVVQREDLSIALDYISSLAFHILLSKGRTLTVGDIDEVNNNYIIKKNITRIPVSTNDLLNISILKKDTDGYSFNQNYIYYFFAAYYINREMKKSSFDTSIIKALFDNFDQKDYSSIIIFLSYFSDDIKIIDFIKEKADAIISSNIHMDRLSWNDINFIDNLSSKIPDITLSKKKGVDYQREEERAKDNSSKDNDEVELQSFKLAEIISALLKNHSDLDAEPKKDLCKKLYQLHLYVTEKFFYYIKSHYNDFISFVKECIINENKQYLTDIEMNERCRNILFILSAGLYAYIVKHITDNAITKNLLPTHDALSMDKELSSKFLDIILFYNHVEYDDTFPKMKLFNLLKNLSDSDKTFFTLLQILISRYISIHFNDIEYNIRTAVCDKMKISRNEQRKLLAVSNKRNNS